METRKDPEGVIQEQIKRITDPIFKKVLQEIPKRRRLLPPSSGAPFEKVKFIFYNLHNYRLIFDFNSANFEEPKEGIQPSLYPPLKLPISNYRKGKDKTVYIFTPQATFKVKKATIEVINKIDSDKWYMLDFSSKAEEQIQSIVKKKDYEALELLDQFLKQFGGSSQKMILKRISDNKIYGDPFINQIDPETLFETHIAKKVYKEPNIEFKDPETLITYVKNLSDTQETLGSQLTVTNRLDQLEEENKRLKDNLIRVIDSMINYLKRKNGEL